MRGLLALVVATVGTLILIAVLVGVASGDDHTNDVVAVDNWAEDACGSVAAWAGQLEAIGDELRASDVNAQRNDGGSGDHVEASIEVHEAVGRAIQATEDTLQEGLKRAGIPDAPDGVDASLILRTWAQETEDALRASDEESNVTPDTTTGTFETLGAAVASLRDSLVEGRRAFTEVARLDAAYEEAFADTRECRDLAEEQS
jgi:hypothetical protein